MAYSWAYNRTETEADHIPPDELLLNFVDAVSKNGNMLLNVGPDGDAQIPPAQASRLRAIGAWARPNGAAIFGMRPGGGPRPRRLRPAGTHHGEGRHGEPHHLGASEGPEGADQWPDARRAR